MIFNRPDLTERSFQTIRQARPAQLHVVADGPRADRAGEDDLCAAARAVTERVDWLCEVTRDYSAVNMGCGRRVSSGITGGFERFEEAIILEDDCLPHPSFFRFCGEILARYRDDERVMHVTGNNFQGGRCRGNYGYYFSKYSHIWGWASWRRAWRQYDFEMNGWAEYKAGGYLRAVCPDSAEHQYWASVFDEVAAGKIDTWDYQWTFACWRQSGLTATPPVNLVSNIGFRLDGTHTRGDGPLARLATVDLRMSDSRPFVSVDPIADGYTFDTVFGGAALKSSQSIQTKVRRTLRLPASALIKFMQLAGLKEAKPTLMV